MALIRGRNISDAANEAIVLDLGDLKQQADQLRREAMAKAELIVEAGRKRAAEVEKKAYDKGHSEGLSKGHEDGVSEGRSEGKREAMEGMRKDLEVLRDAWVGAAHRWDAERREMALEARQSLLELSIAMARRIVHRVPAVEPGVVVDQVGAAIEYVVRPGDVAIRVNPADRELVEAALPGLTGDIGGCEHVHVAEDAGVSRGGCVVTHGRGVIDATLGRQLDRLIESLLPGGLTEADDDDSVEVDAVSDVNDDEVDGDENRDPEVTGESDETGEGEGGGPMGDNSI